MKSITVNAQSLQVCPQGGRIYKNGKRSGSSRMDGYRQMKIGGKMYLEHRVVWFAVHGEWPDGEIDHINRVRDDNRVENLRVTNRSHNMSNNESSNINKHSDGRGWHVRMVINGKKVSRYFTCLGKAIKERNRLKEIQLREAFGTQTLESR